MLSFDSREQRPTFGGYRESAAVVICAVEFGCGLHRVGSVLTIGRDLGFLGVLFHDRGHRCRIHARFPTRDDGYVGDTCRVTAQHWTGLENLAKNVDFLAPRPRKSFLTNFR